MCVCGDPDLTKVEGTRKVSANNKEVLFLMGATTGTLKGQDLPFEVLSSLVRNG